MSANLAPAISAAPVAAPVTGQDNSSRATASNPPGSNDTNGNTVTTVNTPSAGGRQDASTPNTGSSKGSDTQFSALLTGQSKTKTDNGAALPDSNNVDTALVPANAINFDAFLQFLQTQAADGTANPQDGSKDSNDTAPSSDVLAALQQMLQQLLARANYAAGSAGVAGKGSATANTGDDSAQDTAETGDSTTGNTDLMAILSQLAAALNQPVIPQQAQNPTLTTSTDGANGSDSTITAAGDQAKAALAGLSGLLDKALASLPSSSNRPAVPVDTDTLQSLTSKISDFLALLDNQPLQQTPVVKTGAETAVTLPATVTSPAAPAPAMASPTDTVAAVVASASDAISRLSVNPLDSSSSGNNQTPGKDTKDNTAVTNQNATATVNSLPSAPTADFVKIVSSTPATQAHVPAADQVLVQIRNAVGTGENQIRIQLTPDNLGKVDVQLTTGADGKTQISVTADSPQTLQALQNEARSLENALRDIGLKTDTGGLSFNLRGDGGQNGRGNNTRQGGYTKVAAVNEMGDTTGYGTTIASYNYNLSVQQGLDMYM